MNATFGPALRQWRTSRRMSQESLAHDAEVSTRHLSFLETGKARPSREMVLVLASALELELRDRNALLVSAGFAPVYASTGLDDAGMGAVRRAVDLLFAHQEPYGAVLVGRAWDVMRLNEGARRLLAHFLPEPDPAVVTNVVRSVLHPRGLRPVLVNWAEVAAFTVERLERACALAPPDDDLRRLLAEVRAYPDVAALPRAPVAFGAQPVALVHLRRGAHEARLFTMLTTIGTPLDVTAQELTIESYFPADDATDRWVRELSS